MAGPVLGARNVLLMNLTHTLLERSSQPRLEREINVQPGAERVINVQTITVEVD